MPTLEQQEQAKVILKQFMELAEQMQLTKFEVPYWLCATAFPKPVCKDCI